MSLRQAPWLARRVTIDPGTVIQFDDRLEPGRSVRPEDLTGSAFDR
jgi:hypothetical protein